MSVSTKPASGFRDFLPADTARREYVFQIIEEVYQSYGFERLDTPCVERLDTLMGKYGEEGDQLIFKILQRGEKLQRALESDSPSDTDLADMGLRYDLTVPLARVYAQHRNSLPRYFKRYQIAPVWRADRPQRGRFREFVQCDVDVVGSKSMTVEAEVTAALAQILNRLEFTGFRIHLNHRGVLRALITVSGIVADKETDALVAIDKLDKVGIVGVQKELDERGISAASSSTLLGILSKFKSPSDAEFSNEDTLSLLEEHLGSDEHGRQALGELKELLSLAMSGPAAASLKLDPFLARGLSYYTGPIFEIRSDDFSGSLGGGGRYDGLIGMFMKEDVPACGFSLGVERILVLLEERQQLQIPSANADVMVALWDADSAPECIKLAHELRASGLRVDIYNDLDKYKKQFAYADSRNIGFVAILGPNELANSVVSVKNLKTGEQSEVARSEVATFING